MEREKGVASATCYACGGVVETYERPDGAVAARQCDCQGGDPVVETAAENPGSVWPDREQGLIEVDLDVDPDDEGDED